MDQLSLFQAGGSSAINTGSSKARGVQDVENRKQFAELLLSQLPDESATANAQDQLEEHTEEAWQQGLTGQNPHRQEVSNDIGSLIKSIEDIGI